MLNRKLTTSDIGKTFELHGVPDRHYMEKVTLHAIEGDRCYFRCEDLQPVETDLTGNTFPGDFVPCTISEIEEPEEFRQENKMSNTKAKVMEIETTLVKLNKLYLRNDGKVIHTVKEHPSYYKDLDGVDSSTDLTMEGSDGYYYSHKDGRAYVSGTNYEVFLVAEVKCDPFTTLEDLDNAQETLVFVKPW